MPNRTILNKYGDFVSKLHKVLKKRQLSKADSLIINEARLVATLSSNHSWRTFRFLHSGDPFDPRAIRDDCERAEMEAWKEISENDIKEVTTSDIDEHAFSMVLTCLPDKDLRKEYKELLEELQSEFIDGIEPIESRESE